MRKRVGKNIRLAVLCLLVAAGIKCGSMTVYAAPALECEQTQTQPDGNTFIYHLEGDEYFHYYTDRSGVLIQKDPEDEMWKYISGDAGTMTFAGL